MTFIALSGRKTDELITKEELNKKQIVRTVPSYAKCRTQISGIVVELISNTFCEIFQSILDAKAAVASLGTCVKSMVNLNIKRRPTRQKNTVFY